MAKKRSHSTPSSVPSSAATVAAHCGQLMKLPTFLSTFRDNLQNDHDTRYCFVLGSGASISSGIRSGASLANDWLRWLHQQECPGDLESTLKAWAEKEFKKWPGFTWENRAEFYGRIYGERFLDDANGQEWLRNIMAIARPSFGYTVLAQIIATTKHNVVITTNFDNLVQESLNLIGKPRSFIAHSPAEARFIGQHANRPRILKIHGDIDRETYNRDNLIAALDPAWHDALRHILDLYTPIFIGYGGCDPGFMHFLNDIFHLTPNRRRPLWTYRVAAGEVKQALAPSTPPPGHPCTGFVCTFMGKHQAFWVPTPGFDELMLLLSPALGEKYDAATMRATAEQTSQAMEKSRTDACRAARSHDGTHWCPQLDVLTKEAEKHHLGEIKRWTWHEWREYVLAGVSSEERINRCSEAISALPDTPWTHSLAAFHRSRVSPTDDQIDPCLEKALQLLISGGYGPSSTEAMTVQHHQAYVEYARGNHEKAAGLYQALIQHRTAALGPEHPDTLNSRNNLAMTLLAQGNAVQAEAEHRDVLAIQTRVLGADHRDNLSSRNHLGNALQAQGKHAEAEAEHRAVLGIRERVQGAEHPDTLTSRNNLANALRAQAKHGEAEAEHRAVLAIRERVLGAEHPDTLGSRNNLANALDDQGKHAEAEVEHRAVLAIRERVLGAEHPDTLKSRNNLANALDDQGKHAEAEAENRAVLAIRERVQGAEHPDVFTSCFNLALCLENQDKLSDALAFMQRAEAGCRKAQGAEHPFTKDAEAEVDRLQQKIREAQP